VVRPVVAVAGVVVVMVMPVLRVVGPVALVAGGVVGSVARLRGAGGADRKHGGARKCCDLPGGAVHVVTPLSRVCFPT
jgi:hypothetical protein